ncbi:hypothetical protein RIF29_25187 [Crotalaria pallida]|uniref:Uncharacterized protein n=1 Tax=Crotalaria pallida TaxID=3830 RepID=A0AAN9ETB7_CROPI
MELALSLEKLTNEKLLNLHSVRQVASKNGDVQLADFLDSKFLGEQRLSSISKLYKQEGDSGGVKVDKIEMRIFIKQLTGKQLQPKNS